MDKISIVIIKDSVTSVNTLAKQIDQEMEKLKVKVKAPK